MYYFETQSCHIVSLDRKYLLFGGEGGGGVCLSREYPR